VLGIAAHDLRNPLNTILMQASSMERDGPEPDERPPNAPSERRETDPKKRSGAAQGAE
jgi:signal transduction histidine kinase